MSFLFDFLIATNAQSCFNSIIPNSSLLSLPCFKNSPTISPFEILSLRPPEINSVVQFEVVSVEAGFIFSISGVLKGVLLQWVSILNAGGNQA